MQEKVSIGFAVQYKHVSGDKRLSIMSKSEILAKANYLNQFFVKIDNTFTPKKVEEAWQTWVKFHEAQVVEVYVRPCDP